MPEERKLVTILFADIVGSTELGLSHDPEVVRAALGRAFEAASEVLRTHGGTVEKFIGDAIMAVFGVPTAHDDDPERAVRAAFALRERIRANRTGPALQVRVGVNSGEAVTGSAETAQFLVTGPAVNAAARLQQAAAPDEIVVGDLTKRLTEGGIAYAPARHVEAKGIGNMPAWPAERVITAVPEQHRGLPGLRAPLIGRDHEMRTLLQAWSALPSRGEPHLITIYGPAGAGKSRLVSEFVDAIGRAHARFGRCLPYGEGITYYPVQLVIRSDAGIDLSDPRDIAIDKIRAAVRQVLPDDVEDAEAIARRLVVLAGLDTAEMALPEVPRAELRDELILGLRRYLERRATSMPLAVIFEDVHWGEPGLLDLIEAIAEWGRAPMLLLCLARPDFREVRPTWGSAVANATTITLSPLAAEDTRRLISELLAIDDLPESVRSEVVTRSEGNPLYVEEFLRMLIETERIEHRGARWVAKPDLRSVEVPPTLRGLITARLDRVGPDVKALLQRASLAGRLFSTEALKALADDVAPDPSLLRDAVRRDLLLEADERALGTGRVFRFKHVLIRDVAYATLPKAERSRLHDKYGRWLETTLGDRRHEIADIVAHHAEQACLLAHELGTPQTPELARRAFALLLDAARAARDRWDLSAGLNLYERASALLSSAAATPQEAAEIRGWTLIFKAQVTRTALTEQEVAAAIEDVRPAGPTSVLAELLLRRSGIEGRRDDDDARIRSIEEALQVARTVPDHDVVTSAIYTRSFAAYERGDIAGFQAGLLEARAYISEHPAPRQASLIIFWLGRLARWRGDLTAARRYAAESIAAQPVRSKFWRALELWTWAVDKRGVGEFAEALPLARQALALMREAGPQSYVAGGLWELGELLLALNENAEARDMFAEAAEFYTRLRFRGQIPEVRARLARALVRLGDAQAARREVEAARSDILTGDQESHAITEVAFGEVLEAEGDLAAADASFRAAIDILAPTGNGERLVEMRQAYTAFLLRHGRTREAREQLELERAHWTDPLAERHRARIDALLETTARVSA